MIYRRATLLLLALGALESLSHFSTRAILLLHLSLPVASGGAGMSPDHASQLFRWFSPAAAFAPVLGAALAFWITPRRLLLVGFAAYAVGHALLWAFPNGLALAALALGRGLVLPCLYLTLARHFAPRRTDRRDGAFALLLLSVAIGTMAGTFTTLLYQGFLGRHLFLLLLVPEALALWLVRRLDDPSGDHRPASPIDSTAAARAGIVLAACLALQLASWARLPFFEDRTGGGLLALLPNAFTGLVFYLAAAVLWIRRDRQNPRSDEAGKIGFAGLVLAIGLILSGLGDQPSYLVLGESVAYGVFQAWTAAVALSVAASALPGRRAGLALAAWMLAELLVRTQAGLLTGSVWLAAVLATGVAGLLFRFRGRLRVADPSHPAD